MFHFYIPLWLDYDEKKYTSAISPWRLYIPLWLDYDRYLKIYAYYYRNPPINCQPICNAIKNNQNSIYKTQQIAKK